MSHDHVDLGEVACDGDQVRDLGGVIEVRDLQLGHAVHHLERRLRRMGFVASQSQLDDLPPQEIADAALLRDRVVLGKSDELARDSACRSGRFPGWLPRRMRCQFGFRHRKDDALVDVAFRMLRRISSGSPKVFHGTIIWSSRADDARGSRSPGLASFPASPRRSTCDSAPAAPAVVRPATCRRNSRRAGGLNRCGITTLPDSARRSPGRELTEASEISLAWKIPDHADDTRYEATLRRDCGWVSNQASGKSSPSLRLRHEDNRVRGRHHDPDLHRLGRNRLLHFNLSGGRGVRASTAIGSP